MFRSLTLLVGLWAVAESALKLAPYLKPCSRNDPNLDECTLKHGIEAIPHILKGDSKYGIPVLTPMTIEELKIVDADKEKKATGIDITMRDLKIYGLEHFVLKKSRFDLEKKKIDIAGSTEHITLKFKYEIDGKILVLPIFGNGNGTIEMKDVDITYELMYDLIKKEDGLEYMSPGEGKLKYETTKMVWQLDNLFNGNKTLSDVTNKAINDNSDVMNAEFGQYLAEGVGEVIKQILKSVANLVPYDYIFPAKL